MFDWIKSFFQEKRIDLDFLRYERQQRDEHENQAQRCFSTEQLYTEKRNCLKKIESEANSKFNSSIHEKENNKKQNEEAARKIEYFLSFFLRNYKEELNELYKDKDSLLSKKKALHDSLSEIKDFLSEAFEDKKNSCSELNRYKNLIDSWYEKSGRTPWLLGNSGKKLPKHSLFGQSFGDLDSYKHHRDSAYEDLRTAKKKIFDLKQNQHELHLAIENIKREVADVFVKIDQAKKDRSKMYELKQTGYQQKDLQNKLDALHNIIISLAVEINNASKSRNEFINQEKHRHGVIELDAKIRKIEEKKEQFLNDFDSEENKQNRKQAHRKIWLKQRYTT